MNREDNKVMPVAAVVAMLATALLIVALVSQVDELMQDPDPTIGALLKFEAQAAQSLPVASPAAAARQDPGGYATENPQAASRPVARVVDRSAYGQIVLHQLAPDLP